MAKLEWLELVGGSAIVSSRRPTDVLLLDKYGLSPLGESPEELQEDLDNAQRDSNRQ